MNSSSPSQNPRTGTKIRRDSQDRIKILFSGKAKTQRIARKVKPRTLREITELSIGSKEQRSKKLKNVNFL